jgi:hypothetical protein
MNSLLTEQELADYGPEFINMVRRGAAEIASPLQTEIAQLGHVERVTGNVFLRAFDATCPIGRRSTRTCDSSNGPEDFFWPSGAGAPAHSGENDRGAPRRQEIFRRYFRRCLSSQRN